MKTEYEYIYFSDITHKTAKTKRFFINSNESHFCLGEVKWYGAWRKYCFFPTPNSVFETKCLSDIILFLNGLQNEWKAKQQEKKQNQK